MNTQPKIAFLRADGSKTIGMGHLNRVGLIAEMLVKTFQMKPVLITKKNNLAGHFIHKRNLNVRYLRESMDRKEEMQALSEMMAREQPDMVFVDVLNEDVDPTYMKIFKQTDAQVIAVTDDSQRRVIAADVVLNGNPFQSSSWYQKEEGLYLCGTPYFLMDPAYATTKVKEPHGPVKKVLVTLGGSDHGDLLFRMLEALAKVHLDLSALVITSQAAGYLDRLKDFLPTLSLKTELLVDVDSLVHYWPQCDAAITAGGNTLFERIASRLPGATICQLERQNEIADCFEYMEVNMNLGLGNKLSDEELIFKLKKFLQDKDAQHKQYVRARHILDGEGLLRLEKEIKNRMREKAYGL